MDFIFYQFTPLTFGLCIAAGSILLLQILYFFLIYGSVAWYRLPSQRKKAEQPLGYQPSVSVVIVTKDEQENLKQRLPVILEQQYPNFEVVVVNNASSDETEFMLKVLAKIYPQLKIVNLYEETPNKFQGKKYLLSLGIKSAKNDYILLTNANCVPNSYFWIDNMVKGLTAKKNIVLGYNLYERKNTLLNTLIQYESLNNAINYEGMALWGNPYKATGDNLIISRQEFFNTGGFIPYYNISSGDMDLYVNRIAKRKTTSVILHEEAYVKTEAPQSLSAWCRQKRRRLRTAHFYRFWGRFIVATPTITTLLLYALLSILFFTGFPYQWILAALILKFFIQILLFRKSSFVLMKNKLSIFAPIFEIFFLFFNVIIGINTLFSKKERWD
ncbi:MAG: glycosyltransferase [Bacteroidales bacterium]|jgi:cellulose synthase/poly-beta-1,6-N-acetylglucosamine synthase-like glycosyltransferase|nr:glycosyltransferase [Bacteroidales bacterium]